LPQPLTLQPEVKGTGEWLNTATYVFTPGENLRVAMTYTVKVAPLTDMLGAKLDSFSWTFKTTAPSIAQKYPDENTQFVGVTQPISVTFSTEMDKASVESRFTLRRGDGSATAAPISGRFEWDGLVARFNPTAPLTYDTKYTAQLAAGAQDANRASSSKATQWSFTTVKEPAIVATLPKDGDKSSKDIRSGFVINFSAPMDDKHFKYTIVPTITNPSVRFESRGREAENIAARIYGGWLASQEYVVTISGDSLTRYGEKLGKDVVVRFTAAPLEPSLALSVPGMMGMYDANGPQLIYATQTNVERIDYELFRVERNDFMQLIGRNRFQVWQNYRPPAANKLREWSQTPNAPLNASRIVSTTLGQPQGGRPPESPLPPGVYYLNARGAGVAATNKHLLVVSGLNLALKRTDKEALVWVTDLKLGQPVPDVPITLYASPSAQSAGSSAPPLATGKTDKDGLFRATFAGVEAFEPIFALSELDGRIIGAVGSDWNSGVAIWDFDLPAQYQAQDYYANLYTDRSIYRSGQTVYFKGIVRRDNDANYTLPDAQTVPVKVRDGQGKEIFKQDVTLNRFGTFNGEIKLSEAAATGTYDLSIELGTGNRRTVSNVSFVVAEYRRPEFQVETKSDKGEYTQGETIKVETNASYFFGGAVNDAAVTWRLLSEDLFFQLPDEVSLPAAFKGSWDFVDDDLLRHWQRRGEAVREGKGKTDASGKFVFETPADLKDFPLSQSFTLEAEVMDVNHQSVANRVSVPVHKGQYYIGVRPQRYVGAAGTEQAVDVMTVDTQGKLIGNQPISISFYERKWFSVREKREDGGFYWTSTFTDTFVSKLEVMTSAAAPVVARFTPSKGGLYRIVVEGADTNQNKIRSATYLWVAGGEFINWRVENHDRIDLVADKQTYNVGDTAEVLIASPFKDAEALLTIERGTIREVRRIRLTSNSDRVQIPIKPDYAPNVFVSLLLVKGRGPDSPLPQFKLGYASLGVSINAKELQVKVTADKQQYSPNEKATFTIEAKDATGKPVEAEFSIALVDKAVQSLVTDLATALRDAFYGRRGLRVQTAATLVNSIERVNQQTQAEAKGGGGAAAQPGVRRDFRDTAYWNATVTTDATGRAQVTIALPDNLTTWNFMAKGITAATLVGEARADIVSTKDLLVRPVTPRFFVAGDKTQLEAVVNNNGDKDVRANVSIETRELDFDSAAPRLQTITVKAHDKAKVSWSATTPSGVAKAVIKFAASGGADFALQDAVELTIPVLPYSTAEVVATAGQVDTKIAEKIQLPAVADKNAGELTIELAPSLAAANQASLKYLESFDYECSEQTVSKFFPSVVMYQALQRLGVERPATRLALEVNVSRAVQRLYALQTVDGGWGWCARDESKPLLTAYALWSLQVARNAGFAVNQAVMNRAEQFLTRYLDKPVDAKLGYVYNERAFVIFVLSELGRTVTSRAVNLYESRANLGVYGKALLLMTLKRANLQTQALAVQTELTSAAKQSATGASWEEARNDYYLMNTNTRTTALVVMALARTLDPQVVTLTNAVRWLLAARKDGHWQTTQETAWATLALTEYMAASGELQGNYTFNVSLNGKPLGDGAVSKTNIDQARTLTVAVKELALNAANDLLIERNGAEGRFYYAASLRYYLPADQVKALNRGIIVGRQYFAVDSQTLKPTDRAIESAKVGDYVQVKLVVVAPTDLHYLALEDPLPAGFEVVNTTLKTSSVAARAPELKDKNLPEDDPFFGRWYRPWWRYWAYSDLRDDRVAVFATFLGKGTYEYTYMLRASVAGEFRAAPARAYEMYFPEVMGRSAGGVFTVMGN
jgi:hypothetical protein